VYVESRGKNIKFQTKTCKILKCSVILQNINNIKLFIMKIEYETSDNYVVTMASGCYTQCYEHSDCGSDYGCK
jgi:hypothetical protein